MIFFLRRYKELTIMSFMALVLVGCSSTSLRRAPIENVLHKRLMPGSENAGKPGYYTVKPGDNLLRISLNAGKSQRDLAKWNNLTNPNLIEVGQVLRVVSPGSFASTPLVGNRVEIQPVQHVVVTPVRNATSGVAGSTLGNRSTISGAPLSSPMINQPTRKPNSAEPVTKNLVEIDRPSTSAALQPVAELDQKETTDNAISITWMWPTSDAVSIGFNENTNKGLNFSGKLGDPIYAAADGIVVYVGNGLRGYGNLVILKHNEQFLTAYAHNQNLMVKEDQVVQRGQQIATMGSTDATSPMLYFEIRKDGKPIDPSKYLPHR
jgi:lipoprotein NlpD